jgi:hypothetical protein
MRKVKIRYGKKIQNGGQKIKMASNKHLLLQNRLERLSGNFRSICMQNVFSLLSSRAEIQDGVKIQKGFRK